MANFVTHHGNIGSKLQKPGDGKQDKTHYFRHKINNFHTQPSPEHFVEFSERKKFYAIFFFFSKKVSLFCLSLRFVSHYTKFFVIIFSVFERSMCFAVCFDGGFCNDTLRLTLIQVIWYVNANFLHNPVTRIEGTSRWFLWVTNGKKPIGASDMSVAAFFSLSFSLSLSLCHRVEYNVKILTPLWVMWRLLSTVYVIRIHAKLVTQNTVIYCENLGFGRIIMIRIDI